MPALPVNESTAAANIDATATAMAAVTLKSVLGIGVDHSATTSNINESTNPIATNLEEGDASESAATSTTTSTTPVLDKKSLQLALLSLIQDDRFLDLLHSQYLRVARTRAKKNQQHQQQPSPTGSGGPAHPGSSA